MRADAAAMVNGVNEGLPQAMTGRPYLSDDLCVRQRDASVHAVGEFVIVGAISAASGLAHQRLERREHMVGRRRIEVARRLVGEQGSTGRRAAATRCCRPKAPLAGGRRACRASCSRAVARRVFQPRLPPGREQLWHHDVLGGSEFRQQVMELVDEANLVAPIAVRWSSDSRPQAVREYLARIRPLQQAGRSRVDLRPRVRPARPSRPAEARNRRR